MLWMSKKDFPGKVDTAVYGPLVPNDVEEPGKWYRAQASSTINGIVHMMRCSMAVHQFSKNGCGCNIDSGAMHLTLSARLDTIEPW